MAFSIEDRDREGQSHDGVLPLMSQSLNEKLFVKALHHVRSLAALRRLSIVDKPMSLALSALIPDHPLLALMILLLLFLIRIIELCVGVYHNYLGWRIYARLHDLSHIFLLEVGFLVQRLHGLRLLIQHIELQARVGEVCQVANAMKANAFLVDLSHLLRKV